MLTSAQVKELERWQARRNDIEAQLVIACGAGNDRAVEFLTGELAKFEATKPNWPEIA